MPTATRFPIQGDEVHNTILAHVVYRLKQSSDNTADPKIVLLSMMLTMLPDATINSIGYP